MRLRGGVILNNKMEVGEMARAMKRERSDAKIRVCVLNLACLEAICLHAPRFSVPLPPHVLWKHAHMFPHSSFPPILRDRNGKKGFK